MSLGFGKALAFFMTKSQVNALITEALATRGITIEAANYTALTTDYPAADHNGAFAWVDASQGTAWLPGTLGGTYYPLGLYHSNGTDWTFTPSPAQATQSEVNAGLNNDKFVTPLTLANDTQWDTKVGSVAVATANGLAGTSSGGVNPTLTLSTTVTGITKGNGTALSAAVSGTDYAPATSGAFVLYGNNAGGFSNTDVTYTPGTTLLTATNLKANVLGTTYVAFGNYAANAPIGTAAATVDAYSIIGILQSTAGITLTLPTPTQSTLYRAVSIVNIGSTAFTISAAVTCVVAPNTAQQLIWNGTSWITGPATTSWTGGNVNNYVQISYAGGSSTSNSPLTIQSNNTRGGSTYSEQIWMNNSNAGATNPNKYVRMNNAGELEIVNSAYTDTLLNLTDSGVLTVPDTVQGGTSGTTAFIAGAGAVNNVSLQVPANSAIRNTTNGNTNMYFDVSTGGTTNGVFNFRSSSNYNYCLQMNPSTAAFGGSVTAGSSTGNSFTYTNRGVLTTTNGQEVSMDNVGFKYESGTFYISPISGTISVMGESIYMATGVAISHWTFGPQSISAGTWYQIKDALNAVGNQMWCSIHDYTNNRLYRVTMVVRTLSPNYQAFIVIERQA